MPFVIAADGHNVRSSWCFEVNVFLSVVKDMRILLCFRHVPVFLYCFGQRFLRLAFPGIMWKAREKMCLNLSLFIFVSSLCTGTGVQQSDRMEKKHFTATDTMVEEQVCAVWVFLPI